MAKVGIVGMGYVGNGMFKLFSRAHEVSWYDPNPLSHSMHGSAWINAHSHTDKSVVQGVDLAVVCVPTPMKPDGSCDTSIVEEVCGWIDAPLVLIKSTIPPGTVEQLNTDPQLVEPSERFHFSPEYMGEPRNFVPAWKYPDPFDPSMHDFVIVGGPHAGKVLDFFVPCMGPHTRYAPTDACTAELVKYMENSYFAMKVSFVTEFAKIAKLFDVNWHQLRTLWQLDPRVEPDHTLVFPEDPGFGGKCLPKDVHALCQFVREAGGAAHLMEAVLAINNIYRGATRPREIVVGSMDCSVERDTPEGIHP